MCDGHADRLGQFASDAPEATRPVEAEALLQDDQRALVTALKELPARQRGMAALTRVLEERR